MWHFHQRSKDDICSEELALAKSRRNWWPLRRPTWSETKFRKDQDHKSVAGGGHHHAQHRGFRGKGRGYAVYYEDDNQHEADDWADNWADDNDYNHDYEEGYYEDEAYTQDPSPTAADSYYDETFEDFDNDIAYY